MSRKPFTFNDILQECKIETGCYHLGEKQIGARIHVPEPLYQHYPYNGSAYGFLQQLRQEILDFGTVEFPNLPVNKTNHTVALRSPREHTYSSNPFLTDNCQSPHQDTPPYPTAFWLGAPRLYFSTWLHTLAVVEEFYEYRQSNPLISVEEIHRMMVPKSLKEHSGVLVNQHPGLILIDNSEKHALYHARTCNFDRVAKNPNYNSDSPLYAFNEVGLLNYIDTIDSRRGKNDRCNKDLAEVKQFLANEKAAFQETSTIH